MMWGFIVAALLRDCTTHAIRPLGRREGDKSDSGGHLEKHHPSCPASAMSSVCFGSPPAKHLSEGAVLLDHPRQWFGHALRCRAEIFAEQGGHGGGDLA